MQPIVRYGTECGKLYFLISCESVPLFAVVQLIVFKSQLDSCHKIEKVTRSLLSALCISRVNLFSRIITQNDISHNIDKLLTHLVNYIKKNHGSLISSKKDDKS